MMSFVDYVFFYLFYHPVIIRWEEGISLFRCVVDLCQIESVGLGQCLLVDALAPDDKQMFILVTVVECLFK